MSDNNKFSLSVGYKQLLILKNALQLYLTRDASKKDKEPEERFLSKVDEEIKKLEHDIAYRRNNHGHHERGINQEN